ncbi:MAG: alginate lyase family protein [Pseudomonadota bacterium]
MRPVLVYWNTLRHLKPVQFYGRAWFRLYKPRLDLRVAPLLAPKSGSWKTPAQRKKSMLGHGVFSFLNVVHKLDDVGWNGPGPDKLWLYNLHYFDDLNAQDADLRKQWHLMALDRWIADNPPACGNGWEPYPTSLRIVNWIKWTLAGNELPLHVLENLAIQVRWLYRRIEWHLLGNHIFANAKALVYAGLFFEGSESQTWLDRGLSIIRTELPEQVLADGGNFERSTMYHAIFLEDVLDLVNVARAYPGRIDALSSETWFESAIRMLNWAEGLLHPDGQIALFNDAAFYIAPEPDQLFAYAARLGVPWKPQMNRPQTSVLSLTRWPQSGYARLSGPVGVVLIDVAPVGPDYLPGHAHADTLSFEMSVFGQRVVVNGGTSCYGASPRRMLERKTRSHSTVEVAGQDSSEVWGGFRVARRAYPFDIQCASDSRALSVACSHDGYRRLPGKPVHRREWKMDVGGVSVRDVVTGGQAAVARYIIHPDCKATIDPHGRSGTVILPDGRFVFIAVRRGLGHLEASSYSPEFGKVLPAQCLVINLENGMSESRWSWEKTPD